MERPLELFHASIWEKANRQFLEKECPLKKNFYDVVPGTFSTDESRFFTISGASLSLCNASHCCEEAHFILTGSWINPFSFI